MTDVIAATLAPRRTSTLLLTTFGAIALGLAAIGVYGVIAYGVATRAREIGIRVALGASRRHVLRLVLGEGLALAAAGVALGLAGAWALRRVMTALVYGITASDTATYAVAATMLFIVAALATLVPTRRALRVDPAQTMRVD